VRECANRKVSENASSWQTENVKGQCGRRSLRVLSLSSPYNMIDENVENSTGFRLEYNPLCSALDVWVRLEQISGSPFLSVVCHTKKKRHYNKGTSSSSSSGHYFSCQSVQNKFKLLSCRYVAMKQHQYYFACRFRWSRGLRHGCAAHRLLGLWVPIPLGA